jgi:hypothetical protein
LFVLLFHLSSDYFIPSYTTILCATCDCNKYLQIMRKFYFTKFILDFKYKIKIKEHIVVIYVFVPLPIKGLSRSYGSRIYNYLCHQCLSSLEREYRCDLLNLCFIVCASLNNLGEGIDYSETTIYTTLFKLFALFIFFCNATFNNMVVLDGMKYKCPDLIS